MRICLVSQGVSGLGGVEAIVRGLAKALANKGHAVLVVVIERAEGHQSGFELAHPRSLATDKYALREHHGFPYRLVWLSRCLFNDPLLAEVQEIIERFSPDIIHTHKIRGFPVNLWSRLKRHFKAPLVHTCHDIELLSPRQSMALRSGNVLHQAMQRLWVAVFRKPSRLPEKVIFPSEYLLRAHMESGLFRHVDTCTIFNFAEFPGGWVPTAMPQLNPGEPIRLLFLGRLDTSKGILQLCEALMRPGPDGEAIQLTIAGAGALEHRISALARKVSNIEFIGPVGLSEKAKALDTCHAVAVPSMVDEAFGVVVAEAFTAGRPVLASSRGALPELIENGSTGWIYEGSSLASLEAALARLVRERANFAAMSSRCLRASTAFTLSRALEQHLALYREALDRTVIPRSGSGFSTSAHER